MDLVNNSNREVFEYTILLFDPNAPLAKEITNRSVKVVVVQKRGRLSLSLFLDLKKTVEKINPDIAHTHLFGGDLWGRAAARFLGKKVITTEHNINVGESGIKRLVKRLMRGFTHVYTAPSQAIACSMEEDYKIKGSGVNVIRYGIELDRFLPLKFPDWGEEKLRFLILGRLAEQKGHYVAFKALSQIKPYNWSLEVVGAGPKQNELCYLAQKYDLEEKIYFKPPTSDVPSVFSNKHVMLMPSLWEGLGIVVMEAMAAGVLVIGSRAGGIPELIDDQETGFLVPVKDSAAIADRLMWAYTHRQECARMAMAGRQKAKKNYSVKKMVEKYEAIYLKLAKAI